MSNLIAKRFNVFGVVIHTELCELDSDLRRSGDWDAESSTIRLDCNVLEQLQEQTYFHELVHVIDDSLGLKMSHKNIDRFGSLLHQILATSEYGVD